MSEILGDFGVRKGAGRKERRHVCPIGSSVRKVGAERLNRMFLTSIEKCVPNSMLIFVFCCVFATWAGQEGCRVLSLIQHNSQVPISPSYATVRGTDSSNVDS